MLVLLSMFLVKVYFSLSIVHPCLRRCLLFSIIDCCICRFFQRKLSFLYWKMNTFVSFLNLLNINMLYFAPFPRRESVRFSTRFYRFLYEVLMLFRRVFLLVLLMCDIFFFWYSFLSLFYVIINVLASSLSALYPYCFLSIKFLSLSILRASLILSKRSW